MEIPFRNILNKFFDASEEYCILNRCLEIEAKDISILFLIALYHNKLITTAQLCQYFQMYDKIPEGKSVWDSMLARRINTYHSKINDKWYSDTNFTYVLAKICEDECRDYEMSIDQFLKYLNIGFSKNHNWCVNYLAFNIIKPLIYYGSYKHDILGQFIELDDVYTSYEEADLSGDLSHGYCCEDCDGDLNEYKYYKYIQNYQRNNTDKITEIFKNELFKLKKNKFPSGELRNLNDQLYEF